MHQRMVSKYLLDYFMVGMCPLHYCHCMVGMYLPGQDMVEIYQLCYCTVGAPASLLFGGDMCTYVR